MEHRHNLHTDEAWIHVSGSGDRLAQSVCAVVGVIEHDGELVLRERARGSVKARPAGNIQHGSRGQFTSEAFTGVLLAEEMSISMDDEGGHWKRLHRATVVDGEVRERIPKRLRRWTRVASKVEIIF
jgi:hypothetical protein